MGELHHFINLDYVNYKGERISQTWDHEVGYWATEEFKDRAPITITILAKITRLTLSDIIDLIWRINMARGRLQFIARH